MGLRISLDNRRETNHNPLMKLNFWQWIGVILLVIGLGLIAYREMNKSGDATHGVSTPTTLPSAAH